MKATFTLRNGYKRVGEVIPAKRCFNLEGGLTHECPVPPWDWEEPVLDSPPIKSLADLSDPDEPPDVRKRIFRLARVEVIAHYEELG